MAKSSSVKPAPTDKSEEKWITEDIRELPRHHHTKTNITEMTTSVRNEAANQQIVRRRAALNAIRRVTDFNRAMIEMTDFNHATAMTDFKEAAKEQAKIVSEQTTATGFRRAPTIVFDQITTIVFKIREATGFSRAADLCRKEK